MRSDVLALPPGIRADYLRLAELMEEHGADLRMPHSKAMGSGLFELRPKGTDGIARVFYCTQVGQMIVVLHSSRRHKRHRIMSWTLRLVA